MVNGRVVKVREWLTFCVPFPVMYRMYRQLVTAIMPVVSGNKLEMGEEGVYIGGPGGQQPEDPMQLPAEDWPRPGHFKARESVVVVGRGMGDGMMRTENFAVRVLRLGMRKLCRE